MSHQRLEFIQATAPHELSQRQHDRVGLGFEAQGGSGLFHQRLRKI